MIALLLLCCLQDAHRSMPQVAPYQGWWRKPELVRSLGISQDQLAALVPKLENLEKGFQLTSSEILRARKTMSRHFLDPSNPAERLTTDHQKLVELRARIQAANFEARLAVRNALSAQQLSIIAEHAPQFFQRAWFRRNANPVYRGKVIADQ